MPNRDPDQPLRVLQMVASVAPGDGGPSVVALSLNRALNARGVASRIITTDADGLGRLPRDVLDRITAENALTLEWHRVHFPRRLKTSRGLAASVERQLPGVDLVHIHGHYLHHAAAAARLARRAGVPYVVQPHGVFEPFQRQSSRPIKTAYDLAVGRRSLDNAAGFIFTDDSEVAAAAPVTRGLPSYVVPLGAHLDPAPDKAPPWWSTELAGREVICFLGRLAPKKRVDLVIDAMPELLETHPDGHLLIAGALGGELAGELSRRARSSPAHERITFLGEVLGADKTFLLEHSSAFVLPSENENFAISVAEALIAGCPVVVSDRVALSRHVAQAGAGVVIGELTPAAVTAGLRTVMGDGRQAYVTGARAAGATLTWDRCAEISETVYRSVVNG